MSNYIIDSQAPKPVFDLERFMIMSGTKKMDGPTAERMGENWGRWIQFLQARKITAGDSGWMVIWLNDDVEQEVDNIWTDSPSEGFMLDALASTLCMCAVQEAMPEVEAQGCAPAPRPNRVLRKALDELGLPMTDEGTLARRFSVVTYYPFKGGCTVCFLKDDCPNAHPE